MITCKNCGYRGIYTTVGCPLCRSAFDLTDAEVKEELRELSLEINKKNFVTACNGYKMLADGGYTEAEKEYAKILEGGKLVEKNPDAAMTYFLRAAKKNDFESAYRYARIAKTLGEDSRFWLIYSAVFGFAEAYLPTADKLSEEGHEEDAHYFYTLAASCNNKSAIAKLVKRYLYGIGTEKSEPHAKWYLKKLRIPPLYLLKSALALRGKKAKKPDTYTPKNYNGLIRSLANQALSKGFDTAYFSLCELLSERGDKKARVDVAIALIKGYGCKQNVTKGVEHLKDAAKEGSGEAYIELAKVYLGGASVKKDVPLALEFYSKAGNLGEAVGYEALGDVFYTGAEVTQNLYEALRYYDLAARLSSPSAQRKADELRNERDRFWREGLLVEDGAPRLAFDKYRLASAMGHTDATYRLAVCYDTGNGTEKDKHKAFHLYKKSADLGSVDALLPLGLCYATGRGIRRDFNMAKITLTKAERLGVEGATDAIKIIMQRKLKKTARRLYSRAMQLIYQKKFDDAKKHLDISSELSYPKAIYTLGCMYEFGMGTPCNKELAFSLYERAYALLFRDPRSKYKLAVLRMIKSM